MTALKKYQKLESSGLWRDAADAQRREVVVAFGEASLILSDPRPPWKTAVRGDRRSSDLRHFAVRAVAAPGIDHPDRRHGARQQTR
jgi:hypothetical protein